MAQFPLTPSQQAAVDAPIMDLLVSAAAGSGKTAVLSRRILRLVSDPMEHADISRMLIVTFTKAAASELRSRIDKALKEELASLRSALAEGSAEDTGMLLLKEERLLSAIEKLERAEISTIHSFCYSLIRKHVSELGLPASMRIGDEAESELLMMRTMEETVDALYEEDPQFPLFAENLIELRDNKLSEILLGFYKKFVSLPEGIGFIEDSAHMLTEASQNFSESPLAQTIYRLLDRFFAYYTAVLEAALSDVYEDAKASKAYADAFSEDLRFLRGWEQLKDKDYFVIAQSISSYTPPRLGSYRGEKPAAIEQAVMLRKDFAEGLKEIKASYFSFTEEDVTRDAQETAAYSAKLFATLSAFDKRYREEKIRYGILDYNDLERYAYQLLVKEGAPTPLALSVQKKYDAVFIDEYQDTNEVQDAIFAAISCGNRFMVGDIKQSIYGFRGAVPELFSHYRDSFPDYREGEEQKAAKIFLSENFRSDKSVIDYSNRVFGKLFNNNSGRVPYLPDDALVCSRATEADAKLPARFLLVDRDAPLEDQSTLEEADVVAKEILLLLQKGVKPSEIVILLRNMNAAETFRAALEKLSVSCKSGKNEDRLFDHPEVLLLVALLNIIDNPTRDIYLAAVLKSPVFGMTLGELVSLRRLCPATSLYASVSDFAKMAEEDLEEDYREIYRKVTAFLAFLQKARRFAELKSSDKVVRYLLTVTPLRAIATKESGDCRCLWAFYDFARGFEARGFRGVHGLVRRINEINADQAVEPPMLNRAVDLSAVRIMTVHQSKGCEFDYVFLSDTARRFNTKEKNAALVYEKSLGVGLKLREEEGFVRYDTLIRRAVAAKLQENALDEEMRILYVALTRAKKQIIVTAAKGGNRQQSCDDFLKGVEVRSAFVYPHLFAECSSYAEWLALASAEPAVEVVTALPEAKENGAFSYGEETAGEEAVPCEILKERLSFVYPYAELVNLPTKLSVSRLYPGILDDEAEALIRSDKADFDRLPLFMQDKPAANGAERGTATHLFMQFCDYDHLLSKGIDAEISRLVEQAYITEGIASLIYRDKLKVFFASDLFARIRRAPKVYREERFNVRLKAQEFTLDPQRAAAYEDEYILVQGVVDCLIQEPDGSLVLIDYKTDHTPSDRKAAESMLRKRYTTQLSYYRRAVEQIYGRPVRQTLLYSFGIGDTVEIK